VDNPPTTGEIARVKRYSATFGQVQRGSDAIVEMDDIRMLQRIEQSKLLTQSVEEVHTKYTKKIEESRLLLSESVEEAQTKYTKKIEESRLLLSEFIPEDTPHRDSLSFIK
jgi:hypothetical protein